MAKNNQPKQAVATGTESAEGVTGSNSGISNEVEQEDSQETVGAQPEGRAPDDPSSPKMVRARVLAFCGLGVPNDVIEIDREAAATMPGIIDFTPEAVAYALSIVE